MPGVRQNEMKDKKMMSVCGVMCSECPAYLGASKGITHQRRTVEAWSRIYGLKETPENISCGGCLGSDKDLFHTSGRCKARQCCRSKGFANCAECSTVLCPDFERAQSVWDEVPEIGSKLSRGDFAKYARAYCGHRKRLAAIRFVHFAEQKLRKRKMPDKANARYGLRRP